MIQSTPSVLRAAASQCRTVVATLVSGLRPGLSVEEVETRIAERPLADQTAIVAGVLAVLFLLSLLAAQIGWAAMLVFWLAVIVVAR